jgi:hypothetical protein
VQGATRDAAFDTLTASIGAAISAGPSALVLFRMKPGAIAKHVGILTGSDSFLHAYERLGVIEESLTPDHRDYAALMGTVAPQFAAAPAQGHAPQQPTTANQPSQPASAPGAAGRPSWAQ